MQRIAFLRSADIQRADPYIHGIAPALAQLRPRPVSPTPTATALRTCSQELSTLCAQTGFIPAPMLDKIRRVLSPAGR
ncbi:hypothetical protein AB0C13_33165 [Streptomyces sp. NPDC049099]|uniref:hypothetical protein n=1 Tax=Streptomyces sp. NPDC049099 TaxID=3155768 RepID=UPI0034428A36